LISGQSKPTAQEARHLAKTSTGQERRDGQNDAENDNKEPEPSIGNLIDLSWDEEKLPTKSLGMRKLVY
jgi:hypothetical protein